MTDKLDEKYLKITGSMCLNSYEICCPEGDFQKPSENVPGGTARRL